MDNLKYTEILAQNKILSKNKFNRTVSIKLLSNVTINSFKELLEFTLRTKKLNPEIEFGNFDNIVQDSLSINNEDIVLAAVTKNGLALKFAHDSLKSNEDIVLAAVRQNRSAFKFADRSLKKTIETRLTDEATTSCYGDGVVSATCSNIANIMEAFF
jgi:hypothetical protein